MNDIVFETPETTPKKYIGGMFALNIIGEETSGDWHFHDFFYNKHSIKTILFGEDQEYNTNSIFGSKGIEDRTLIMSKNGFSDLKSTNWVANHSRAVADLIYLLVVKRNSIRSIVLEDWFPTIKEKEEVYRYLAILENRLNEQELKVLRGWKALNPIKE